MLNTDLDWITIPMKVLFINKDKETPGLLPGVIAKL